MTRGPTIWPSEQHATANMRPGDTLRVLGGCWFVVPALTDWPTLHAASQTTNRARLTDPDTSHQAANKPRTGHRARVLAAHLAHPDGLDDFQLAALTGLKQTSCGVRRAEMTKLGWFHDTGRRGVSDTGSDCIIWQLTELGRQVAA